MADIDPDLLEQLLSAGKIDDQTYQSLVQSNPKQIPQQTEAAPNTPDQVPTSDSPNPPDDANENAKNTAATQIAALAQKYPEVKEVVSKAHDESGLTEEKAEAYLPYLFHQESGGDPNATGPMTSHGGTAKGKGQLMDATGKEEFQRMGLEKKYPGGYDPYNKDQNEEISTDYFKKQFQKFGDPQLALAAYNWGPGALSRHLKATGATSWDEIKDDPNVPKETKGYVDHITNRFMADQKDKPQPEGIMAKLSNILVPNAEAEERTPNASTAPETDQLTHTPSVTSQLLQARPGLMTGAGDPSLTDPVPVPPAPTIPSPLQQQALAAGSQAAQQGDAGGTLDALASGETNSTDQILQNAETLKAVGGQESGEANIQGFQKQADLYKAGAEDIAKTATDFATKKQAVLEAVNKSIANLDQKVADVGNASIDPASLYNNASTFGKILLGIGLVLNAVGNTPAQAMANLQNVINADISSQKAQIDLKKDKVSAARTLLEANFQQYKDLESAEAANKTMSWAHTGALVDQTIAQANSDVARGNLKTLRGQIAIETEKNRLDFQKKQGESAALKAISQDSSFSPSQQRFADIAAAIPKLGEKLVLIDGKPAGFAGTTKDKANFEAAYAARNTINTVADEFRANYKQFGTPVAPGTKERTATLSANVASLRAAVLKANQGNVRGLSKEFVNELNKDLPLDLFPESPTSAALTSLGRLTNQTYINTLIDKFQIKYNRQLLTDMQQYITKPTPELRDLISTQKAQYGLDSDFKKQN